MRQDFVQHDDEQTGEGRWPRRLKGMLSGKTLAAVFSILMICAVLSPIIQNWRSKPKDSFPLSYYPMFSKKRSQTEHVTYLVGLDAKGERHIIPYRFAGTGGMNQVRKQIRKFARRKETAAARCQAIAEKVAQREGTRYADLVAVQIVTGEYRRADYFTSAKRPLEEKVHASCAVERRSDEAISQHSR